MKLTFWGVRGSIPAPGPETARYGGNTLCIELRTARDDLIILDAGTGLATFGNTLLPSGFGKGQGSAAIMLSHAHMDHIQGFPFFAPIYIPGNSFVIYGRERAPGRLEAIFEGQMNPHFSPVHSLKNLGASIEFESLTQGTPADCFGVSVDCLTLPHGSTTALAFRFEEQGRSLVVASDAGYTTPEIPDKIIDFYRGAEVLIHDCTYTPEDRAERQNRGFSSIAEAAQAATRAGVGKLVMIHYDQDYTDDDVDALHARCRTLLDEGGGTDIELVAARERDSLDV
ncbi:MAG: MBL fold metallo-hydrolase [bacterium]